ncbi:3-keto-5-aminohexanoate cleavage protein [Chloroflexota bacterium]
MNESTSHKVDQVKFETVNLSKERVTEMFPVDREPRIPTMDKPLVIESACPGWQIGGERFPAVPISIVDQVKEISDSVKAGAIAIHVHPRDPKTGLAQMNPKLLKEVLDGVFEEVGDCVTLSHTWYPVPQGEIDYINDTEELLKMGGGNKYVQGTVILPIGFYSPTNKGTYFSAKATADGIKWLEAHHVKPIYQLYDSYTHLAFKQHIFDHEVSNWKPFAMNLHLGKHNSHAIQHDPWAYLQTIANVNMVKDTIPESIVGVYSGGRNWLPVLTLGILMGAELVRVGIEDCYWLYPHRDELIKKNSDVIKMTVELANILGRTVVTDASEARKILGMKLTSKL